MSKFTRLVGFITFFYCLVSCEMAVAQDGEPEQETIYVKVGRISYIKLPPNYINGVPISPVDFKDYFKVDYLTSDGSIAIDPIKANTEPAVLNVRYKSEIIQLLIVYKESVQPSDEPLFNIDISQKYKDINTEIITTSLSPLKSNEILRNLQKQEKPIPLSIPELDRAYPGIKFDEYPSNQTLNMAASKATETRNAADALYYTEVTKALYFGNDDIPINLAVQGISYLGSDAFIKILIQNNSNQNFLTGAMLLTLKRKEGKDIKLHPGFIMPSPPYLPLILPGAEKAIVYCFKAYSVLDEDQLKFELHDRQNKINLEFSFSGKLFNEF